MDVEVELGLQGDEGSYRCVISNRFGKREHRFKLFVSSKSDLQ